MSQLGGDTMILLTLKMKLFYMGVHTALGKSQKFAFDPKCRITLVHSLKTIRDDWWLHTEVAFFPLLYTLLFVKSSRKENDKDSILWKDTAAFRRLCPFLKKSGKGTWLIGGASRSRKPVWWLSGAGTHPGSYSGKWLEAKKTGRLSSHQQSPQEQRLHTACQHHTRRACANVCINLTFR